MSEGEVQVKPFTLGTLVIKFQMPMQMIDEINNTYENAKDLPAFNSELAGKIENEFKIKFDLDETLEIKKIGDFKKMFEKHGIN